MRINVFPMYVGVILRPLTMTLVWSGIPHVCGGDPAYRPSLGTFNQVFPMYVGVIPPSMCFSSTTWSIPHVCGGDPLNWYTFITKNKYSPCMWG